MQFLNTYLYAVHIQLYEPPMPLYLIFWIFRIFSFVNRLDALEGIIDQRFSISAKIGVVEGF